MCYPYIFQLERVIFFAGTCRLPQDQACNVIGALRPMSTLDESFKGKPAPRHRLRRYYTALRCLGEPLPHKDAIRRR